MKKFLATIFLINQVAVFSQMELIWSSEFDSTSLDLTKWTYDLGAGGWGNAEPQYYTANEANVGVDTGYLRITAIEEDFAGADYTSARIKTQDRFQFKYGRIEARIKLPIGQGIWPAFWMLGSNITEVSWPKCGEIDIMEHVGNSEYIHGTYHYDNWGHTYYGEDYWCDVTQFHVYAVEWDHQRIKWFVDGALYYSANIEDEIGSTEEFHHPFFIILNMATGGYWPGYPDASTEFPAHMYVDYVRVYQNAFSGITEQETTGIRLYPNPTNNVATITGHALNQSFEVTSLTGAKVLTGQIPPSGQLDVSELPAGCYVLAILSQDGEIKERLRLVIRS